MAALMNLLPTTKSTVAPHYDHSKEAWFKLRYSLPQAEKLEIVESKNFVPLYLKRDGFRPSMLQDFGEGGAFPEIHYAQYPLDMGRKQDLNLGGKTLPVTSDEHGRVTFDAIVKQGSHASKTVYSRYKDLVPKILRDEMEDEEDLDDMQKEIDETTEETKACLEKIVNARLSAAQPKNIEARSSVSNFIKYKPSAGVLNSGAKERMIKMVETQMDPLEPPKFKHKRVPRPSGSPPVPVMHSPVRAVTVKDQQDWKIPPCISSWKNPKGYVIPLDKRLASNGAGLQDVKINDNFAKLHEALQVAYTKAQEALTMRAELHKELMKQETERKEREMRALAHKARSERAVAHPAADSAPTEKPTADAIQRENIREERRRERKRGRRLEAKDAAGGKKSKNSRDYDRDISEKVALGMASSRAGKSGEIMYDQRLFNQEKGMDSGFATDDQYNIYSKGLFTSQATLSTLYRPKTHLDSNTYGTADEQMDNILNTSGFKPDKAFSGTSKAHTSVDAPLEFDVEEDDPFGLNKFMNQVKTGKKALDKIGRGGTMKASAGTSIRDCSEGFGRTQIGFQKGSK